MPTGRRKGGMTARWRAGSCIGNTGVPTLCGVAMAASAYAVSLPLLLWMSPVIVGLLFAVPIGALTASPAPPTLTTPSTPHLNRGPVSADEISHEIWKAARDR